MRILIAVGVFLFFFLFFIAISFHRFDVLQVFYYDFGIFARIIWQASRFQLSYIEHLALGRIPFLGDHFNPSLILIAPLFWLTSDLKILLVEQVLATVFGGVLIYKIAKKLKLSDFSSLTLAFVHLAFAGIENPLVTDWHPEPTAGFFLLLFFYLFCFTKRKHWTYLTAFIFLGFKESNAITFLFLLIFLFFYQKRKRKEIVNYFIIAVIWFFTAVKVLIPFFAGRPYYYSPEIPLSPITMIKNFFNQPQKIKLIVDSLFSYGFLPILFFAGLIPVVGELGVRLIPSNSFFQSYNLLMHYNVFLGCFLSLSTIYAILKLKRILPYKKKTEFVIILYLLLVSLFTAREITFSPLNMAINRVFWQELGQKNDFFKEIAKIPQKGTIMSQNNLLSHFVKRKEEVYLFSGDYKKNPDIIVFETTKDQNPNNFYPTDEKAVKAAIEQLIRDKTYRRVSSKNKNLFVFIKE